MSGNDSHDSNLTVASAENSQYEVMLPCEPEQFGQFISGLLGKPQTIEKSIYGIFEIARQEVINTFHLVDQRIHQQNDASLVQFTVKILYDDNSSILLNNLIDFEHYTEIRPIASVGLVLSWTYLIKFKNKQVPEKQEVNLSFNAGNNEFGMLFSDDGFILRKSHQWIGSGRIFLRINHTERTWGVDIESLLTGHVKTLFKEQTETKLFINKHSEAIGLTTGILLFLSAILGVILTSSRFIDSYLSKIHAIADKSSDSATIISSKLDFLIEVISTGVWPRFIFVVVVFLVISLILAIAMGSWVGSKAESQQNSYVLLSKAAQDRRIKDMNKLQRDWLMFSVSIITSVVTGIASNIIFTKYFGGLS